MGVRFPSVQSSVFVGPLPGNANETVVCTTPPFTPSLDGATIILEWFWTALAGATQTFFQMAIRRGTTVAGTLIGASALWAGSTTAGASYQGSGSYFDTPGNVSGQQYSLTLIQGAATGAGTFRDVALVAFSL